MFLRYRNIYIAQYQGLQNDSGEETGVGWGEVQQLPVVYLLFDINDVKKKKNYNIENPNQCITND